MRTFSFAATLLLGTLLGLSAAAPAQQTISTYAGGGPNNLNATSVGLQLSGRDGLATDSAGNVYFAVNEANQVYKITPSGLLTVVAGVGVPYAQAQIGDGGLATQAELNGPEAVVVDAAGNIYIADTGNDFVREVLAKDGTITTIAGNSRATLLGDGGPANAAALSQPNALALDAAGNLYISDSGDRRVREVVAATGIINTIAGGGTNTADNIPAAQAQLIPIGIAVDSSGNVYIADEAGVNRIREVAVGTGLIATVAGGGNKGMTTGVAPLDAEFGGFGALAIDAGGNLLTTIGSSVVEVPTSGGIVVDSPTQTEIRYFSPQAIAVDPSGTVYVDDWANKRIDTVSISGGTFALFAGNGDTNFGGDGAPATEAELSLYGYPAPTIATDAAGDLFIADTDNNRIREVAAATGKISTVVGTGESNFLGDGDPATSAALSAPDAVFVDGSGNIYIADTGNRRIREVSASTGKIATIAGGGTNTGTNIPALQAELVWPNSVVVDGSGNVFFGDYQAAVVREVLIATGNIITVAGGGSPTSGDGDGGPATSARLSYPEGITLDASGNLFIADSSGVREVVAASGIIQLVAGGGSQLVAGGGSGGDGGLAIGASLSPRDVKLDVAGNLYIADSSNARIRRVNASTGVIETIAGNNTAGFAGDNGPAIDAEMGAPAGLALDGSSNLYVADPTNQRIRKISNATSLPQAALAPATVAFGNQDVGIASNTTAVTLTNAGNADLNLLKIGFSGTNAADFSSSSGTTCAVGSPVLAGSNCVFNVIFTPSSAAVEAATLTVTDDAVPATQSVVFSGTGVTALSFNPANIGFPDQTVGTTSPSTTMTMTNTGAGALTLNSFALSGANAADFAIGSSTTCAKGLSLPSAASCTVVMTFTPTVNGSETATLTFNDTAAPTTQTLTVAGAGVVPTVTLTPAAVNFGNQGQNVASATSSVTVTNAGPGALIFSKIGLSGSFAADFSLDSSTTCVVGTAVAASSHCNLGVVFKPSILGAESGSVTLADNASGGGETLSLTGTGTTPAAAVSLAPATLSFASQGTGTSSAAQTATLMNTGQVALTITSVSASGDFAQTNTCGASVAAGATCTIAVTFTPTAAGTRTGTLSVVDSATGSPHTVTLTGVATAPAPGATLAPATLTFASLGVGGSSAAQTLTLSNSGGATLTGIAVNATGDFAATSACAATLAPAASCVITVVFKPTAAGARTGLVSVADNATGSPQTAALTGTATAAAAAASLSPTSLNYVAQAKGVASAAQTVTLTNSGTAALTIASVASAGDFAQTNTCGASLAAGAHCAIAVTFTPTATGARTGTLTVTDNAPNSPQTAALTGTGADLTITPGAGSSTSSTVTAGQPATYGLSFAAVNGLTGSFALTCTGAPTGATCTPNPATVVLGSSPTAVTVTATTTARSLLPPAPGPQSPAKGLPLWAWALGLVLALATRLRAANRRGRAWISAGLAFACFALMIACGGGSGSSNPPITPTPPTGTPAGTYTLTLTATGGGATRTQALSLIVQ